MRFHALRGRDLKQIAKRLLRQIGDDNAPGLAAQLSYYFLFSLFPGLLFLVTLAAFLPLKGSVDYLLDSLRPLVPSSVFDIVSQHLTSLVTQKHGALLVVAMGAALWSASTGVSSLMNAFNVAYGVKDSRSYAHRQLLALSFVVFGSLFLLLAASAMLLGGKAGAWLADQVGWERYYADVLAVLRWPIALLAVMSLLAALYYVLPDVRQEFRFLTPGSVFASLAWVLVSFGFSQYVGHFDSYNKTYGSIGGVIVLVTLLYLTALIFVVGGEINAAIEHLHRQGKERGEKAPGEKEAQRELAELKRRLRPRPISSWTPLVAGLALLATLKALARRA